MFHSRMEDMIVWHFPFVPGYSPVVVGGNHPKHLIELWQVTGLGINLIREFQIWFVIQGIIEFLE